MDITNNKMEATCRGYPGTFVFFDVTCVFERKVEEL
jgi:hypothetical protein